VREYREFLRTLGKDFTSLSEMEELDRPALQMGVERLAQLMAVLSVALTDPP
jgi:hypothetical protein